MKRLLPVQASFLNERKYTIYSYIMCVFYQKMSFYGEKMYIFVKNILNFLTKQAIEKDVFLSTPRILQPKATSYF